MASDFPRSPKFLKGALVAYESNFLGPIPNIIVFQYNPESLNRTLSQRTAAATAGSERGAARTDANRVAGPPKETITLTVQLRAADQLAEPANNPHVVGFGLNPALAAMELLLYPSSEQYLLDLALSQAGTVQHTPPDLPLVLFIWGPSRVLPVRLTSFTIKEQAFDQLLNPIQAEVDLGLEVLTYMDLQVGTLGHGAYVASQVQKEVIARLNLINTAQEIVSILP